MAIYKNNVGAKKYFWIKSGEINIGNINLDMSTRSDMLVVNENNSKPAGWFVGLCTYAKQADQNGGNPLGKLYLIYCAKLNDGSPNSDGLIAAPCPPFCSGDGYFDLENQIQSLLKDGWV